MSEFSPMIEKYNPLAGSTVQESIKKAKERARENDSVVLLRFNGINIFVDRTVECDFLERYYMYKTHMYKYENAIRD